MLLTREARHSGLLARSLLSETKPCRSVRGMNGLLCTGLLPLGFSILQLLEATVITARCRNDHALCHLYGDGSVKARQV